MYTNKQNRNVSLSGSDITIYSYIIIIVYLSVTLAIRMKKKIIIISLFNYYGQQRSTAVTGTETVMENHDFLFFFRLLLTPVKPCRTATKIVIMDYFYYILIQ